MISSFSCFIVFHYMSIVQVVAWVCEKHDGELRHEHIEYKKLKKNASKI